MQKTYRYVGPKHIAERSATAPPGVRVESADDVTEALERIGQSPGIPEHVIATFVVDEQGWLRISHRRSEHVACAGGNPVLSAGEITFTFVRNGVEVSWITNQSTGYCPEPDSWPTVRDALERAGIKAPEGFSRSFIFRRCLRCGSNNLVKDGWFECDICSSPLPHAWNLDDPRVARP